MVRKVIDLVYKEVRGLHQAAYILALFAFGSQLIALLRDRLLANEFGAGAELDIYYAAFRIPDLLFVLIISLSSVYILIPFIAKAMSDGQSDKASHILSQVFSLLFVAYIIVGSLMFWFIPTLMPLLFPGIENQEMLINLTRVLLLQPILLGVSGLFGVISQLSHRFVVFAISPLLYNIGIIAGIVIFYPLFGLIGLVWGVVVGALLHLMIQWPLIHRSSIKIGFDFNFDWPQLWAILAVSVPRSLTLSMQQLVLLVLISLASGMAAGSVSIFQFAFNLQSVPLAIIGVSYSVAAFPILAELYSKADREKFSLQVITALRHIIFWSVPVIALIIVLRAQLVRVVLGSGAFDWADTRLTAAVLALLCLSLLAQAVYLVVMRAFYAGGKTMIPFYITLAGSLLAIVLSYGFLLLYSAHEKTHAVISSFMRLEGVGGSEVLVIALGYSIAVIIQSLLLTLIMGRVFAIRLLPILRPLVYSFCAATVGGLMAYITLNFIVQGIDQGRLIGVFIQGFIAGTVGIVGVIITYAYFKSPELKEIYRSFHKKILKTDVLAPQEEVL